MLQAYVGLQGNAEFKLATSCGDLFVNICIYFSDDLYEVKLCNEDTRASVSVLVG